MTRKRIRLPKWTAHPPVINTVRDVRQLAGCSLCGALDTSLITYFVGPITERGKKQHAHPYCFIEKYGFEKFAKLPAADIERITLDQWQALGLSYETVDRACKDAHAREKRAAASARRRSRARTPALHASEKRKAS